MVVTPNMTKAFLPEIAAQHESSCPGMAHFAGTGPEGTRCHECVFWNPGPPEAGKPPARVRRDTGGYLRKRRCRKYPRLMQGQKGKGVPGDTPSCRHFAGHENPPDFFVDPEIAKAERAKKRAAAKAAKKVAR